MRRAALAVLLLAVACGGGSGGKAATAPSPAASGPVVDGMRFRMTDFGPANTNVYVGFFAASTSTSTVKLYWDRLVLIAPDGSSHHAKPDTGSAPYDEVDHDGLITGYYFEFPKYRPGRYSLTYNGQTLQAKTL